MSAIRDGKRGCESRDIASYVRAKRSARKRHTRRAAVACVQLHADDDEADSGQGFIIPFRFFPQPCCDKTETQRVTIQHADVQKASCGRAAALPQTRCHSLKEKRHHKRILRPLSTETIGCRAPIGSLSFAQTSTIRGLDGTTATSFLSPPTDANNASVSEAATQKGSVVALP